MAFDLEAEIALLEQDRGAVAAQHRVAQPRLEPEFQPGVSVPVM